MLCLRKIEKKMPRTHATIRNLYLLAAMLLGAPILRAQTRYALAFSTHPDRSEAKDLKAWPT